MCSGLMKTKPVMHAVYESCAEPSSILVCVCVHSTASGKKVSTRFDFLFPGPDLSNHRFCNGMVLSEILQLWGFYDFEERLPANIPCIIVNEPVAHLLRADMWMHLGCRPSRAFSRQDKRHELVGDPDSLSRLKALFRQASSCPSIFQPGASACKLVMSKCASACVGCHLNLRSTLRL